MDRFRTDNTDGYAAADLANLNAAFSVRMSGLRWHGIDVDADDAASLLDNVAERILADYDSRNRSEGSI